MTLHRRPPRCPPGPPAARGFAMIEALIALLIFSFAALGLVGLQASLVRATSGAKYRAEAAYLASDLVGTLWTDTASLVQYRDACDTHAPCKAWTDKVARLLPGGTPVLDVNPVSGVVTITLTWTVPGEGTHRYATSTAISANTIATP